MICLTYQQLGILIGIALAITLGILTMLEIVISKKFKVGIFAGKDDDYGLLDDDEEDEDDKKK